MNPSRGDCIEVYDLSFATAKYQDDPNDAPEALDKFDISNYLFCPWESNCLNSFVTQQERLNMSVEEISNNEAIIGNTCCSGSQFYTNTTHLYNRLSISEDVSTNCNKLNTVLNDLSNYHGGKETPQYRERIQSMFANKNAPLPLSICDINKSNIDQNKKGMLFEAIADGSYVVFLDENQYNTPQQIFDYMALNSFSRDNNPREFDLIIADLSNLVPKNVNDYDETDKNTIQSSKEKLYNNFSLSSVIDICYQYQVYNTSGQIPTDSINKYLLNENEFYSCSGDIINQQTLNNMTFTQSQLDDFSYNNYFGDSSLNTIEDEEVRFYNTENDFKMQLRNLPDLNQSSMAPVSVINQYMTSINSFYEKQMANMMGPKTHYVNDTLQFDNDTLESKQSTFFSYNGEPNNEYECENSITGNSIFDYCGPQPYSDYNPIQ